MPEIALIPLSQAEGGLMADLMRGEEQAWRQELDWDYSPIRRILSSFLRARILPGFLAVRGTQALGYTYFLISRSKGVIGTLYVHSLQAQETADLVLSRAIESMKATMRLRRIEAQIIPLEGVDLNAIFMRHGFQVFPRHYLELDLAEAPPSESLDPELLMPWQPEYLAPAAKVAYGSYQGSIDAIICEDYRSEANCADYLRSLTENPGCGIFLPDSSFVSLDAGGDIRGFILTSRLSRSAAMIPQISILPSYQGKGLGSCLIRQALKRLRETGYQAVRLTVTVQNRRAFEWYQRLGFRLRREFSAYVWPPE
jgi:ribosomal protein S18 acetylase RimI-like enzyme